MVEILLLSIVQYVATKVGPFDSMELSEDLRSNKMQPCILKKYVRNCKANYQKDPSSNNHIEIKPLAFLLQSVFD